METYIFLDVDGVLNNKRHYKKLHKKYGGRFCCENMPFNPRSLRNLKRIVDATDGKIVLSSSWRLSDKCMTVLEARLIEYGIKIFSKTERLDGNRGNEITSWLSQHAQQRQLLKLDGIDEDIIVFRYDSINLIIDDEVKDISYKFNKKNIIKTNMNIGLNIFKTIEAIIKYKSQLKLLKKII